MPPTKSLSATIDVAGFDDAAEATTDLGRAVSDLEPLAEKLGATFDALCENMTKLTQHIEDEERKADEQTESQERRKSEREAKTAQSKAESEEERLKQSMAKMVGGGVNALAYQQQMSKLEEQQKMIRIAEEKRLISHRDAQAAVRKLKIEHAKLNVEAAAYTAAGGGKLGQLAARVAHKTTQLPSAALGAVKNQVGGVATGAMGLMKSLPIAGGLFGLLMYGITNRDRINAETGEIVNIAVAASGKLSSAGAGFLGSFQQTAEHYFGINRQEVQSVLKTFVDAGISINDILTKQSSTLGLVGHDIMTLTLGIDKHFEMSTGSSARAVVSLVHDFGMSIETAGDMYTKLAFAGSRSGMGTQNFVNSVMQGASALRTYGVSVENVAVVLTKLQERYESMGMPKQLAGQQASMSLQQITQGMSGMSSSMQAFFGERMGMGHGLEARMNFREGMERIGSGNADNQFFSNFITQAYSAAMESTGGDKTASRFMLEQQGFGFEGAKGIMSVGDKLASGVKLNELSLEEQQNLRQAFKTEGQKQSEIAKNTHTIMQGMATVGEGILQVVTNIIAYSILFYKSLPTLIMGSEEEKKRVWAMADSFFKSAGKGFDKMIAGSKQGMRGMSGLLGPILDPMIKAVRWDPRSKDRYSDIKKWNYDRAKTKAAQDIANGITGADTFIKAADKGAADEENSASTRWLLSGIADAGRVVEGATGFAVEAFDQNVMGGDLTRTAAGVYRRDATEGMTIGGATPPTPPLPPKSGGGAMNQRVIKFKIKPAVSGAGRPGTVTSPV